MIDIGANLTDKSFRDDLAQVIERAVAAGVEKIVVTGTDLHTSKAAQAIAHQYPSQLTATAGIHPHHADSVGGDWLANLRTQCIQGAVAVGETGLDFFRNFSSGRNQRRVFQAQLELASELNLPVFVHDRDTNGEVLEFLSRYAKTNVVVHCFTGDAALLQEYLNIGCYIGITGWICDERRGGELAALAPKIPDERLMLETDSPYLMPRTISPRPKTRRNEPMNLPYVLNSVATLRGQSELQVNEFTTANAVRFFKLTR